MMKVFSKNTNTDTININQRIMDIRVSKDQKLLGAATYDNELQIIEIESAQMIGLIDLKQSFGKGNVNSISFTTDNSKIMAVGTNNYLFHFDIPHRIIFRKQEILFNMDFDNTKELKNSRNIVSGIDIKELSNKVNQSPTALNLLGNKLHQEKHL